MRHLLPFLALFLLFTGCDPDEVQTPDVAGCTDPDALNFDLNATSEDGSCEYEQAATTACADGTESVEFDGHSYSVLQIGDDCWFAENLRTTTYSNGSSIPANLDNNVNWTETSSGATTIYGELNAECTTYDTTFDACSNIDLALDNYGRLYNHYAVIDPRGLCPVGWHVSTIEDWINLEVALGMPFIPADTLWNSQFLHEGLGMPDMVKSTTNWGEPGWEGTNESGFNAIPAGHIGGYFDPWTVLYGNYLGAGSSARFHTSDIPYDNPLSEDDIVWSFSNQDRVVRGLAPRLHGCSVRCVQD